ncbi:MAG TPA: hypothetical protein VKB79_11955 [Bryobacteraceae bacterium]|nr:hypothetical protein [Bryobacteraceae bacterium]
MKKEADWFDGREPQLIYIAKRLREAQRLEEVLDASGVDYSVEADEYQGGVIFRRTRIGAFFYVRPEDQERAIVVMKEGGFPPSAGQAGR